MNQQRNNYQQINPNVGNFSEQISLSQQQGKRQAIGQNQVLLNSNVVKQIDQYQIYIVQQNEQSVLKQSVDWMDIEDTNTIISNNETKLHKIRKEVLATYTVKFLKCIQQAAIVQVDCRKLMIAYKFCKYTQDQKLDTKINKQCSKQSFDNTQIELQNIFNNDLYSNDVRYQCKILQQLLQGIKQDAESKYYNLDQLQSYKNEQKTISSPSLKEIFFNKYKGHCYYSDKNEDSRESHQYLYVMQTSLFYKNKQPIIKLGKTIKDVFKYSKDLFGNQYKRKIKFYPLIWFEIPCQKEERTDVDKCIHTYLEENNSENKIYFENNENNIHVEFFVLDKKLFDAISYMMYSPSYMQPYKKNIQDKSSQESKSTFLVPNNVQQSQELSTISNQTLKDMHQLIIDQQQQQYQNSNPVSYYDIPSQIIQTPSSSNNIILGNICQVKDYQDIIKPINPQQTNLNQINQNQHQTQQQQQQVAFQHQQLIFQNQLQQIPTQGQQISPQLQMQSQDSIHLQQLQSQIPFIQSQQYQFSNDNSNQNNLNSYKTQYPFQEPCYQINQLNNHHNYPNSLQNNNINHNQQYIIMEQQQQNLLNQQPYQQQQQYPNQNIQPNLLQCQQHQLNQRNNSHNYHNLINQQHQMQQKNEQQEEEEEEQKFVQNKYFSEINEEEHYKCIKNMTPYSSCSEQQQQQQHQTKANIPESIQNRNIQNQNKDERYLREQLDRQIGQQLKEQNINFPKNYNYNILFENQILFREKSNNIEVTSLDPQNVDNSEYDYNEDIYNQEFDNSCSNPKLNRYKQKEETKIKTYSELFHSNNNDLNSYKFKDPPFAPLPPEDSLHEALQKQADLNKLHQQSEDLECLIESIDKFNLKVEKEFDRILHY